MKLQIRNRDRRALLFLGIAAILYGVISLALLPAFDSLGEAASNARDKEQQLSKYRRALVRKGHYAQLLQQVRNNVAAAEARFIRGDNPTLAAVEVQTIVETAAQKNGIDLTQRNISTARRKDDFFTEIIMTLTFEATSNQLSSFLAEIRNAPEFVVVRNAQIAPAEVMQEAPKKGDAKKMLRANLTIAAALPVPVRNRG